MVEGGEVDDGGRGWGNKEVGEWKKHQQGGSRTLFLCIYAWVGIGMRGRGREACAGIGLRDHRNRTLREVQRCEHSKVSSHS